MWVRFATNGLFSLPSTGGIETFLHADTRSGEPAQTGKLHPRQLNVIPKHPLFFIIIKCVFCMCSESALVFSEITGPLHYLTMSFCGGSGCQMLSDSWFEMCWEWTCWSFLSCCNLSEPLPSLPIKSLCLSARCNKAVMCCFAAWIKWRGCWLCRARLWLRLWVCLFSLRLVFSLCGKMTHWLKLTCSVNVLLFWTGHKPEGCKEQPSATLSVQRGQAVETAAGTVQSVTCDPMRTTGRNCCVSLKLWGLYELSDTPS